MMFTWADRHQIKKTEEKIKLMIGKVNLLIYKRPIGDLLYVIICFVPLGTKVYLHGTFWQCRLQVNDNFFAT